MKFKVRKASEDLDTSYVREFDTFEELREFAKENDWERLIIDFQEDGDGDGDIVIYDSYVE